jgi:hypothetical protein
MMGSFLAALDTHLSSACSTDAGHMTILYNALDQPSEKADE